MLNVQRIVGLAVAHNRTGKPSATFGEGERWIDTGAGTSESWDGSCSGPPSERGA